MGGSPRATKNVAKNISWGSFPKGFFPRHFLVIYLGVILCEDLLARARSFRDTISGKGRGKGRGRGAGAKAAKEPGEKKGTPKDKKAKKQEEDEGEPKEKEGEEGKLEEEEEAKKPEEDEGEPKEKEGEEGKPEEEEAKKPEEQEGEPKEEEGEEGKPEEKEAKKPEEQKGEPKEKDGEEGKPIEEEAKEKASSASGSSTDHVKCGKAVSKDEPPSAFPETVWTEMKQDICKKLNMGRSVQECYALLENLKHKQHTIKVFNEGLGLCSRCEHRYGCYDCDFVKTLRWALKRENKFLAP